MAAISVFVDDAIRGDLPLVCAKTGEPADLVIRRQQPVRGACPGWAWLLVLFGPPGWLALLVALLLWPRQEYLTIRVPQTESSYTREKDLEHFRTAALVAAVGVPLAGILTTFTLPALWLAVGAAFMVAAAAIHVLVGREDYRVSLDASRRWVTFTNVHPTFVEAVNRREALSRR
jgi:MFS family permease